MTFRIFGYFVATLKFILKVAAWAVSDKVKAQKPDEGDFAEADSRPRISPPTEQQWASMIATKSADCVEILKGKYLPMPMCPFKNTLTPSEARSGPNQRLVLAFGILNCFVTADTNICSAFRSKAIGLVQLNDEDWKRSRDLLGEAIETHIPPTKASLKLIPKVQFLSLKLALSILCGHGSDPADDQAIYRLASEINRQWIWSNTATQVSPGSRLPCIKRTLGTLFPVWESKGCSPDGNPLNLILPGYETLWRTVLRALIEVGFRDTENKGHHCDIMEAFFVQPTKEKLVETRRDCRFDNTSASTIVRETLRLYPPTRRIYRRYEDGEGMVVEAAADVETLQRSVETWGADASMFRPGRWTDVSQDQKKGFLAFGASPFPCITKTARSGFIPFGEGVIALLVGGLVAKINKDGWVLKPARGDEGLFKVGEPLDTSREAYADLRMYRLG